MTRPISYVAREHEKTCVFFFSSSSSFPGGPFGQRVGEWRPKETASKGGAKLFSSASTDTEGPCPFSASPTHTHTHLYVYFQVVYSGPETGQPAKKLGNDSFVCPQTQIIRSNRPRATNSFGRGGKKTTNVLHRLPHMSSILLLIAGWLLLAPFSFS